MARSKRSSKDLELAERRLAGITSISSSLDLGGGLTVASYRSRIEGVKSKLETYNQLLSKVDAALNEVVDGEKSLRDTSERMLAGVGSKYGKDSDEYEKAGGKKKSERKRRTKKKDG